MRTRGPHLLAMLEDDCDRLARFTSILATNWRDLTLQHWRSAFDFIAAYSQLQEIPTLIGLDHDLIVDNSSDPDPGDGRDVALFLATQAPVCPILIHSSNSAAADSMLFTLRDAGWNVDRIAPIGEDWIESYWLPTAMAMIK